MKLLLVLRLLSVFIFSSYLVMTYASNEQQTANYLEQIRNNPQQLALFMLALPKGGDIHHHLVGASYAENLIRYGRYDGLCVNPKTFKALHQVYCDYQQQLQQIKTGSRRYNDILDAWSMRDFKPGKQSGHDHFFSTFAKFHDISKAHPGELLAEVSNRAGTEHELYLETMVGFGAEKASALGKQLNWDNNFQHARQQLEQRNIQQVVHYASTTAHNAYRHMRNVQQCSTKHPQPGCRVVVRFQYETYRNSPPPELFAQLLTAFMLAQQDPLVVGVNLVQPEDDHNALKNYDETMAMFAYFKRQFPTVPFSLHAGELAPGLVPAEDLSFHINHAVMIAGANRIGHGVDLVHETNYPQLLKLMATKKVAVEINLTSNQQILGITGKNHPFPIYLQHHVPTVISTDDEGIERTNLSKQYAIATTRYHLSYSMVKQLSRNSLSYAFISGDSLWQDPNTQQPIAACAQDKLGSKAPSVHCQQFLAHSHKAQLQWQLEKAFNQFEAKEIANQAKALSH